MTGSGIKRVDDKASLWRRAGFLFVMAGLASGVAAGPALADSAPTVPVMAAPAMQTAPIPATTAPAAPVKAVPVSAPQTASPSSASNGSDIAAIAASIAPVAAAPVAASAPASAAAPSAAELAIVQTAAAMNAPTAAKRGSSSASGHETEAARLAKARREAAREKLAREEANRGLRVTDILSGGTSPATVRPLPSQYLVVKKNRSASNFESRLVAARRALSNGHYAAALEMFNDLFSHKTNDLRVLMGRAVSLQKLGQTEAATDTYKQVLKLDPDNLVAMTNMLGLIKGEDTATAIKKLQRLRHAYPANVAVTAQLGMVYGVAGDYSNAIKYLDMADAMKPGDAVILYNRAVAYDHLGKTAEAANLYHRILDLASQGALSQSLPLDDIRQRLSTLQ